MVQSYTMIRFTHSLNGTVLHNDKIYPFIKWYSLTVIRLTHSLNGTVLKSDYIVALPCID